MARVLAVVACWVAMAWSRAISVILRWLLLAGLAAATHGSLRIAASEAGRPGIPLAVALGFRCGCRGIVERELRPMLCQPLRARLVSYPGMNYAPFYAKPTRQARITSRNARAERGESNASLALSLFPLCASRSSTLLSAPNGGLEQSTMADRTVLLTISSSHDCNLYSTVLYRRTARSRAGAVVHRVLRTQPAGATERSGRKAAAGRSHG